MSGIGARTRRELSISPLRTMTTNSRCTSFESALRKVKGKRRSAAWEAAADLSNFTLSEYPEHWADLLTAAVRIGEHRKFERALAAIGAPIADAVNEMFPDVPHGDQLPLIRIRGESLGAQARVFLEEFEHDSPEHWGAALESLAISCPEIAEHHLISAIRRFTSRRDRGSFAVALVRCGTAQTFQMLRDFDLSDRACLSDELLVLPFDRFERLLSIAEAALSASSENDDFVWPLGIAEFHTVLAQRLELRVTAFLEKLSDSRVWRIKKDAVCELTRRGNARGLRLARELCLHDKAIAEVAVYAAFSLGEKVPFDWFAKIFLSDYGGDCDHPGSIIRRRVLERLPTCADSRWSELSCQIAPRDPNTAAQIRLQMTAEAVRELRTKLLSPSDTERVQAVIKLGELKDVVVLPWISSRVHSDDSISREEYFGFIEALRHLGSTEGVSIIKKLRTRCGYDGFANDFALETIDLLTDES